MASFEKLLSDFIIDSVRLLLRLNTGSGHYVFGFENTHNFEREKSCVLDQFNGRIFFRIRMHVFDLERGKNTAND